MRCARLGRHGDRFRAAVVSIAYQPRTAEAQVLHAVVRWA